MTQTTGYACPRCQAPLEKTANFCANCGADISGVWGPDGEPLGKTIAVEINPAVDTLAQLLTKATLGDYDIYGELGRGGMAAVYLGLDLALNRKVAIKTMLPELVSREGMVERFKREAQTAAALSHPHIIQIFTVKQTKELVYFVMKFIEGRSLESVVMEKGQLSVDMSRMVLSQVASALAYAHRKHVVHRDIKPANIMIDEDGWAIVTDFGIAKVQEAQNLTATGTAIGTPHYMSPEQFHNKAITGQSDQYSLGIVAYEMLIGKKPFDGATYAEIITQHLFEPAPDVRALRPDIPENVAGTIARMLAKDPAARFPDLDAVAHELGIPQKTDGVAVRTEMISLAKNGPQKKVRMSVPISPVPVTRKAEEQGAATVLEKKPTRPRPKVEPATGGGKRGVLIALGAVIVAAAGFGAWTLTRPDAPATQVATQTPSPAANPANPADPRLDSPAVVPSGEAATGSSGGTQPSAPAETQAAASVPVAPPPPSPARVTVGNVPSSGVITVDGRRQTGRTFSLRAGEHTIQIRAAGFEPMTRRLNLAAGEIVNFDYDLRPVAVVQAPQTKTAPAPTSGGSTGPSTPAGGTSAPATAGATGDLATLQLIITPPATVYLDNVNQGEKRTVAEQLVPGTHTLRFEKDGWITKDTVVTLTAGQTARIRINLTQRQ